MRETLLAGAAAGGDTGPEITPLGEGRMVREDCWRQVHRLFHVEQRAKAEIARQLGLDRKTVRAILQAKAWQPYTQAAPVDSLLTAHTTYLQHRAQERGASSAPLSLPRISRPLRGRKRSITYAKINKPPEHHGSNVKRPTTKEGSELRRVK